MERGLPAKQRDRDARQGITVRERDGYCPNRKDKNDREDGNGRFSCYDPMDIPVWVVSPEGRILYFNAACEHIAGYSAEEIRGRLFWEFFALPGEGEKIREALARGIETRLPLRMESCLLTKQQQKRIIQWSAAAMPEEDGSAGYLICTGTDLTEQKAAEAALQQSEERYLAIIEDQAELICRFLPDGRLTFVNGAYCRFFQREREELLGFNFLCFLPQPDRQEIKKCLQGLNRERPLRTLVHRVEGPSGEIRWQQWTNRAIFNGTGELVGFQSVGRDITEQILWQKAMQESAERYRRLVEFSPDAIVVHCQEKIVFANAAAAALAGTQSPADLLGLSIRSFIHADSLEKAAQRIRYVLEEGKEASLTEETFLHLDGSLIYGEVLSLPFQFDGQAAVQVIIRDIGERKEKEKEIQQSHELLEAVMENIPISVFIKDVRDFSYVYVNHLLRETRLGPQERAIGKDDYRLFFPEEADVLRTQDLEILRTGAALDIFQELQSREGKDSTILHTRKVPILPGEDGKPRYILGMAEDITDQKRAEEEMIRTSKMETIGLLAGGIAHDFNNILTVILGNISLARRNALAGNQEKVLAKLEDAEKAVLQSKNLTQQLLTFSKGGAPIVRTASVRDLLKEAAGFALRGSNVRCEFEIPSNLWTAEIDEGQIGQVINNMIFNAEEAMPAGGVIRISARNLVLPEVAANLSLPPGRYLRIAIQDQGVGIPKDCLSKVFDPYFTTKRKGSGLGLATSFSIIQKHRGCIDVESEVGLGTIFTIYLPASTRKVEAKKKEGKAVRGSGKILLMDDEEGVREVAGQMLREIGYQVESARDGVEALWLYRQEADKGKPFDAVILDLTIPGGMGGKETLARLKEEDPKVRAIVSSGYSNDPVMADYPAYGFEGMVAKPYQLKELSRVLQTVIGKGRRSLR